MTELVDELEKGTEIIKKQAISARAETFAKRPIKSTQTELGVFFEKDLRFQQNSVKERQTELERFVFLNLVRGDVF